MSEDKILGLLFGCAIGDALGAPIEFLGEDVPRDLKHILEKSGPEGMVEFMPYTAADRAEQLGIGAVTDDTTMLACTAEALRVTLGQDITSLSKQLVDNSRQAFLNWGVMQRNGEGCRPHIYRSIKWREAIKAFWFKSAAGHGTVATLASGGMPEVASGGYGCGGMMRVAGLAPLPRYAVADIFKLGKDHAAITHVDATACQATGVVLQIAHLVYHGISIELAVDGAYERLLKEGSSEKCQHYFDKAVNKAMKKPGDHKVMDSLCKGDEKVFMAGPVLAQVIYALLSAPKMLAAGKDIKSIFTLAVTHSGDTDSVGAIAGAIIGAAVGYDKLPHDWADKIILNKALKTLGQNLSQTVDKFNQRSRDR